MPTSGQQQTQSDGAHGIAVEDEVRRIAAVLGLADFVYRAEMVSRGAGSREPGDALLYANGVGAIVQVKSREPGVAETDSPEKVQQWIDKHGAKAYRQAEGTRRQLAIRRNEGEPVLALPLRASHLAPREQRRAALVVDMAVETWPTIVVLDHPLAREAQSPPPANVFWITATDWHDLHRAIRSTTGLLTYVARVLESEPTPRWTLGTERHRFAHFVELDREAGAQSGGAGGYLDWTVLTDPEGVEIYRDILERLWPEDGELPGVPIDDYRLILEHLDNVPPGTAAQLGRWVHSKRRHLAEHRSWSSGAFMSESRLTIYACDHADNYQNEDHFLAELIALMTLRGRQVLEQGVTGVETAAVGVLQGEDWIDYRFAYAATPTDLPLDVRFELEQQYGVFDLKAQRVRLHGKLRRNAKCPCGSELKYKRCHGSS